MHESARQRVIVILGPTAGGKSDLAMELARRLGGELVSADSMQVYRGMDIGTAKPTRAEQAEIRHHGIDLVDASAEGFTVARWLKVADAAIDEIRGRGKVPIVVGGTNLYIRAFLEGLDEAPVEALLQPDLDPAAVLAMPPSPPEVPPRVARRLVSSPPPPETTSSDESCA